MNLTTNSINFNGKKEVLYGLKKAAQEARNIETNRALSQGPRGINKTEEIAQNKAAMNAYLDMTINDDAFIKTASDIANYKQQVSSVRNILRESNIQSKVIKPFETFSQAISNIIKQQRIAVKSEFVEDFLHGLK